MNAINKLPKFVKITLLAALTVLVITSFVITTILVLRIVKPQDNSSKDEASKTEVLKQDAVKAENTGNIDDAIADYKQLLAKYESSGDKNGAADAQAKIIQLNSIKDSQKKAQEQEMIDEKQRAADAGADIDTDSPN